MADRSLRVLIAGAGPGGLTAARALRDLGFSPLVLEQRAKDDLLADVGGAYDLGPHVLELLRRLGLAQAAAAAGNRWQTLEVWTGEGRHVRSLDLEGLEVVSLRRSAIQRLLAEGLEDCIRADAKVVSVEQDAAEVRVILATGEILRGDVLIGADGVHSAVRKAIFADGRPHFCDAMAAWGRLPEGHPALEQFVSGRGHLLMGHPGTAMAGAVDGLFIWSVMWPVPRYHRAETAAENKALVVEAARAGLPSFAEILAATPAEDIAVVGLWDRDPVPHWCQGRVALLGDAAHATSPYLGQGAQSAMVDAWLLAQLLGTRELEAAFAAFEAKRMAGVNQNVLSARRIGGYLVSERVWAQLASLALFAVTPSWMFKRGMMSADRANDLTLDPTE